MKCPEDSTCKYYQIALFYVEFRSYTEKIKTCYSQSNADPVEQTCFMFEKHTYNRYQNYIKGCDETCFSCVYGNEPHLLHVHGKEYESPAHETAFDQGFSFFFFLLFRYFIVYGFHR